MRGAFMRFRNLDFMCKYLKTGRMRSYYGNVKNLGAMPRSKKKKTRRLYGVQMYSSVTRLSLP